MGHECQRTLRDSARLSMIYMLPSTLRSHSIGSCISASSLIPLQGIYKAAFDEFFALHLS